MEKGLETTGNELITRSGNDDMLLNIFNQLPNLVPATVADTKEYLELEQGELVRVMFIGITELPSTRPENEGVMVPTAMFVTAERKKVYSMSKVLVGTCIEENYTKGQPLEIVRVKDKKNKKGDTFHRFEVTRLVLAK